VAGQGRRSVAVGKVGSEADGRTKKEDMDVLGPYRGDLLPLENLREAGVHAWLMALQRREMCQPGPRHKSKPEHESRARGRGVVSATPVS
jgi:hypothetical protein